MKLYYLIWCSFTRVFTLHPWLITWNLRIKKLCGYSFGSQKSCFGEVFSAVSQRECFEIAEAGSLFVQWSRIVCLAASWVLPEATQMSGSWGCLSLCLHSIPWASLTAWPCSLPSLKVQVPKHIPNNVPSFRFPPAQIFSQEASDLGLEFWAVTFSLYKPFHIHHTFQTCLIIMHFSCHFFLSPTVIKKPNLLEASSAWRSGSPWMW